ncbi:MAG: nucleotide exchange factor GrpE [Patescibacteria group bacterium]
MIDDIQKNNQGTCPEPAEGANSPKEENDEKEIVETELEKFQKERDEYLDGWKRAKADLINYKKDEAKRFEMMIKFANESLIKELINVLDSFDLAFIALGQSQTNADNTQTNTESPRESAHWQKGLYLIRHQLEDALKQQGLERVIVSVGQPFNPALQEAIASIESDKPSEIIIEEVERGYLLNGKLIRPARVKVSK